MQIDLIIRKQGDPNAYTVTCDLAERLIFGRNIVSPVNLTGSEISREHFALFSRNGEICVQDLSSNGTVVNGKPVPQTKPQRLSEGDVISVPGYDIELGSRAPVSPIEQSRPTAIPEESEQTLLRWVETFTVWEMIVIASAIGSFVLILYYMTR